MSCCGGGHSSNKHNKTQKASFWKWLVGIGVIVGFIYWFN